ncbi:MAG: hypothetical protein ACFCVK_18735 [Acidimicrobiales bacterium]
MKTEPSTIGRSARTSYRGVARSLGHVVHAEAGTGRQGGQRGVELVDGQPRRELEGDVGSTDQPLDEVRLLGTDDQRHGDAGVAVGGHQDGIERQAVGTRRGSPTRR